MAHWLIKSEPSVYPWSKLTSDGKAQWDGVRNFEARNNLRAMRLGDLCFYYHSNEGKEIVGIARVVGEARPDPTAPGEDWSVVDVAPDAPLANPVGLARIKSDPALANMALIRRGRISVVPVTDAEWAHVLSLAARPDDAAPPAPKKRAAAKTATKKSASKKATASEKKRPAGKSQPKPARSKKTGKTRAK